MQKLKQRQSAGSPEADPRLDWRSRSHIWGRGDLRQPGRRERGKGRESCQGKVQHQENYTCGYFTGAQSHWGTLGVSVVQAPQSDTLSVPPEVDCLHSNSHQSLVSLDVDPLARTAGLSGQSGFRVLGKILSQVEVAQLALQWSGDGGW